MYLKKFLQFFTMDLTIIISFCRKRFKRRIWKTLYLLRKKYWKIYNLSVPIEKEIRIIDKTGKKIAKTISYRLKFIDSTRVMVSSVSSLVNKLAEGIHKIKCKYGHHDIKCQTCWVKYKDCDYFLEYTNLTEYRCLCC